MLKVLRPAYAANERARRSMAKEGQLLAGLPPPGLTRVFDATLYAAVAKRPPHSKGRHEATGVERFPQLVEEPSPLDPARHSPGLVDLIIGCLRRSPEERPRWASC